MDRTDRHALPYVIAAQAQKHVTVNETTRALDALVHMTVKSRTRLDEPATPQPGEGYILPPGKTGPTWAGYLDHQIVIYQDGAFALFPPTEGMTVYVADEAGHVVWDGTAWILATGDVTSAPSFGVNASADATNKLAVKSDAVLFSHDDITPGSGDVRAVVNKAASTNTASVLFQTGYAAHAEFGLLGTDGFTIKVSPDGVSFFDAMVVDPATGAVSFPNSPAFVGGQPAFSPPDIAGLVGWWDPSDVATVTTDAGGKITSLADKSANSADAVQANPVEQPSLLAGSLLGRDAINFDGTTFLDISAAVSTLSGNDLPFSAHFVMQSNQTASTQIPFGIGNSTDNTKGFWFGLYSNGEFRLQKRSSGSIPVYLTESDLAPHFVSLIHDGTTISVWIDGVRIIDAAPLDTGSMDVDRMSLGAWVQSAAGFHFEGLLGEVLVYDQAHTDQEVKQVQRYLGDRWFNAPQAADFFLAIGQSNMLGQGDAAQSPAVASAVGFEWSQDNMFQTMSDPVGAANTGSCLPAFANGWLAATGRASFVLNMAVGSTSLLPAADSGFGNWDKTQGTHYNAAVAAANSAYSVVSAGSIYSLHGVYGLWSQGERDATGLHQGIAGVTGANYQTALQALVDSLKVDLVSGLDHFFLFELGARDDGAQEPSWAEIRTAQNDLATADATVTMVFTGAKDFPANGMMGDNLHYSQAGYNLMGTQGAASAAAEVG